MERIDYRIEGLDCAEEVAALKKVLHGKKGVLSLDFDILKSRMMVTYESGQIDEKQVLADISGTGMRAIPWPPLLWQSCARQI